MTNHERQREVPRTQEIAEQTFSSIEHFLHIEGVSSVVLLFATTLALIWANSDLPDSYHAFWHAKLSLGIGSYSISNTIHFWVNDGLMTFFFLVVGMEIRSEIYDGALSSLKQAILPAIAAVGGIVAPVLIYLIFNNHPERIDGWAIPMATDIAFAVGLLALLGKSIPSNVRIFLLTLAIIDDIIAVLVIAFFYSTGLNYGGFLITGVGMFLVLAFQRIGISSAFGYVIPGAVVWYGILLANVHPALAGVILGFMTPVTPMPMQKHPLDVISSEIEQIINEKGEDEDGTKQVQSLRNLQRAQRELLPAITRVQNLLHPWVANGVMPLFALANAGITFNGNMIAAANSIDIIIGVAVALVLGKPLGICLATWIATHFKLGQLPEKVTWRGITLVGILSGIGFTMSIFIAILSFKDAQLLDAAKAGVLVGSFFAAVLGLSWGTYFYKLSNK